MTHDAEWLPEELSECALPHIGQLVTIKPSDSSGFDRIIGKVGVVKKRFSDGEYCVDLGEHGWWSVPPTMCHDANEEMALSCIRRNSIGGWTILYPAYDDYQGFVWFMEKHYDADQREMAWSVANEKEERYCQDYC